MQLYLYDPVFLSESGAAASLVTAQKPKNTRHHAKALFKQNKVEHNIDYIFNPRKDPSPIPAMMIKALTQEVAAKLELLCNMKKAFSLTYNSESEYRFSFVAFGFDEGAVLKTVELFDRPMQTHGWDSLQIAITRLDGSVERVDFTMKSTVRYGGMNYGLNTKLM